MPWIAKRRTRQPPRLIAPDLSDFGLRVAFAFNAADPPRDAISGALNTGTSSGGGLDFRGGDGGVAAFSSATQNRGLSYSGVVVGAEITVFAIINDIAGIGAARGVTGCDSSTAGNRTWVLQLNGSNQAEFTTFNTAGGFAIAAGGAPTAGEPFVLAGRLFGSSTQSFINGNLAGSATLTGTPRTTTGKPVFVGHSGRNNTNSMRGDLYEVFIVDGAAPDELIKAWNSPEVLRAAMYPPRRIWVPFTASGGGTSTDLAIQELSHAHALDAVVLTTSSSLAVDELSHAHGLDSVVLSTEVLLTIDELTHAHALDNVTLSDDGAVTLALANLAHAHALDSPTLTTEVTLAIADSVHAHTVDNLTLTLPGGGYTDIELAIKILRNRKKLDAATGQYIVYDDDGVTVLYSAAAWEDAAGTIPYRGGDVRRIDRLE